MKQESLRKNDLFEDCFACEGEGRYKGYYGFEQCHACEGFGIILTEKGGLISEISWRSRRLEERLQTEENS
jgi:DnaJ-class molecular chaperone